MSLSSQKYRFGIRKHPGSVVIKAPDPGSWSATLLFGWNWSGYGTSSPFFKIGVRSGFCIFYIFCCSPKNKFPFWMGNVLTSVTAPHHEDNVSFLKGQCHEIFCFRFFHESPSPKPLIITLGSFQIFSKIRGDIRKSRCTTSVNDTGGKLPPVSTTTAANLPPVSTTPVANGKNLQSEKF